MSIEQLDYNVFQIINQWAGHSSILDGFMRFLSKDAEYLFYLAVIVYWFTRKQDNRRMVIQALTSACLGFVISIMIGHLYYRDRPFVVHDVNQMISHPANASFPSDHAIGAFVIAASIYLFRRRDGLVWMVIASFVAFSRVWNGVHYPLDVVAGGAIGVLSALIVYQLVLKFGCLQSCVNGAIRLYERMEKTVWPKGKSDTKEV